MTKREEKQIRKAIREIIQEVIALKNDRDKWKALAEERGRMVERLIARADR